MQTEISHLVDEFEGGRLSRRALVAGLMGVLGGGAMAMGASGGSGGGRRQPEQDGADEGQASGATFAATDVNHVALRVTDVARSRDFYVKHLGMKVSSESPTSCFLRCGERDFLALFAAEEAGMDHYCFGIRDYDPAEAVKKLEAAGIEARRRGNRVYFDDPDGIEVQVASKTHGV